MIGVCKKCGKNTVVFKYGKGLDRELFCYYHRPKKHKKTGELELFLKLWEERPHISFLTGLPLKDPFGNHISPQNKFFPNVFAHVLPKGRFPEFRLNQENIIFLSPEEHYLLDNGTEKDRNLYSTRWNKIYTLREKLKGKYANQ